ncbi:tRNA (adenine-N1)-methyltransferase [Candidatus Woesearchaeota archaeon]|nr:tRNA (adenine-N1)-methyltransferase [Candidatus Woesearchaeota archaeon]
MRILASGAGRLFYVSNPDSDFHTQFGFISRHDLKNAGDGSVVKTNTGKEFYVFSPGFVDLYRRIKRGPQIVPLKDLGAVVSLTGIGKDSVVVDAGSGSGAVACFLANLVKEVHSYEIRPDFFKIAEENVKRLGLANVFLKNRDVYEGMEETGVDLVFLDLPEPWKAVPAAHSSLKVGGFLVSYSPTIPQVADFVSALGSKYMHLRTIEVIERDWEISERKVRPRSVSIGHSGFLSFARKIC